LTVTAPLSEISIPRRRVRPVRPESIGWLVSVVAIAGCTIAPIAALVVLALGPAEGIWSHLVATVLPRATGTTLMLLAGVGGLSIVIGVGTAWLVSMCAFPGRRIFNIVLLLPLAVPTYIVAYTYVEALDYSGPVQSTIRAVFGFRSARDYWFPDIRSLWGAILVMALVLYPYVYLTTRAMFLMQSACALDVSRTLGAGPWRLFFRVAVPLARPAIAIGAALTMMEALNDIGAVEFFGVRTLTFTVYDTWLNRGSLAGAAQIAVALLGVVLALIALERMARRRQRYHLTTTRYRALPSFTLSGAKKYLAIAACAAPVLLGFGVPALVLLDAASRRLETLTRPEFTSAATNSLVLAAVAAALTVGLGLVLAYAQRVRGSLLVRVLTRAGTIGYAIPGAVLAVGILIPTAALDNLIDGAMRNVFGISTGLLISGSGFAIVYAYATRFLTISFGSIETGLAKVSPSLDMAARTLGRGAFRTLGEVHLPLIRPILLSAALLVFVDCMKELPATILLRPFNFETLATLVYGKASLEIFEDGAVAALAIVVIGLIPVIVLANTGVLSFRNAKAAERGATAAAAA